MLSFWEMAFGVSVTLIVYACMFAIVLSYGRREPARYIAEKNPDNLRIRP